MSLIEDTIFPLRFTSQWMPAAGTFRFPPTMESRSTTMRRSSPGLAASDREALRERAVGVDRGTVIPVAASNGQDFQFRPVERKRVRRTERAIQRWQRKLARRQNQSVRRRRARQRIAALGRYQADLRWDFAHQTSRKLADDPRALLFVFEDLRIQNMTASAKGTAEAPGQRVRQKAGLNRAILASAWGRIQANLAYKARRAHKLLIEVPPLHSSRRVPHLRSHSPGQPDHAIQVCLPSLRAHRKCG